MHESLKLLRHQCQEKNIEIIHDHQARSAASIEPQQLQQVLVNLMANAIEALGPTGRLTLSTRDQPAGRVCLSVADNGHGIETQHLSRIFDPFFTVGKAEGTGLGLSVSYGIIKRYGGELSAQSVVGEGSVLTVDLPAVKEQ